LRARDHFENLLVPIRFATAAPRSGERVEPTGEVVEEGLGIDQRVR